MLKKFAVSAVMAVSLMMGASQLMAVSDAHSGHNSLTECDWHQYQCCPSTNNGAALTFCISTVTIQTCSYADGSSIRMVGTD